MPLLAKVRDVPGTYMGCSCSTSEGNLYVRLTTTHMFPFMFSFRCEDSQGEYLFDNGALVHFQFSGTEDTKGLTAARNRHGMDDISSFDAVFVNPGNDPPIGAEKAIKIALEVQAAGTQLFWLSTYRESGEISKWSKDQRGRFNECGPLYVDTSCMARGMNSWTKGDVEGVADRHFCMPGPPNEIALLLLRMVWAMFEERK